MKSYLVVFVITFLSFFCKPIGDPAIVDNKTTLYFYIVNKNKQSIINFFNGPFYPESTIVDEHNNPAPAQINGDGFIEFELTDRTKDELDVPLRKTYYVNLIGKTTKIEDIDTLVFQFTSTFRTDKDPSGIENFSCYYNDSLHSFKSFPGAGNQLRLVKK